MLQPKPAEGARYVSETSSQIDQTLTIAGMEVPTDVQTTARQVQTVGRRDGAGKLKVEQQMEAFQVNMNAGGMNYTFDSANPDNRGNSQLDALLRDIHKAVAKRQVTLIYNDKNRIESVALDQDILGGLPVQTQDLVRSELSPEALKEAANQQLDRFPDRAVKPGDTWQRTETVQFGAGQAMTFTTKYTYEGQVQKDGRMLDKIVAQPLSVTFAIEKSPLPLTLKKSDLKVQDSQETIWFDRERSQVTESQSELHVVGDLTFEANNMELPAKLDLTMRSKETQQLKQ